MKNRGNLFSINDNKMMSIAFKMIPTCKVLCLVLLISATIVQGKENVKDKEKKEERKNAKLPPCAACNSLVKSFQAGMKRTARGKLEGGDTAWEEKTQVTNF